MLENIMKKIEENLKVKDRVIIAIDGQAASGKTTLATKIGQIYDAPIIHMDDYFLQPHQRVEQRLYEIGGNIDYERFEHEVISHLNDNVLYIHPFNCQTMSMEGLKLIQIDKVLIIEGAYSMRTSWLKHYDIKVLVTIDSKIQQERMMRRNPHLYQRFVNEWIPKENEYLSKNQLINIVDVHLHYQD